MKKNLDTTKRRHSDHILPVPWPLVISRFHCIVGGIESERVLVTKKNSKRVVDPVFTSPNQSRDVNVNVNLIYSGHALSYTSTKLS